MTTHTDPKISGKVVTTLVLVELAKAVVVPYRPCNKRAHVGGTQT